MDRASLEELLESGLSVEAIGRRFGKHPSTVSYWMNKYGLAAVNREKHAARGALRREELEELVAAGRSIAEIAHAVDRSKAVVRHWLRRYGLRTRLAASADSQLGARAAGLKTVSLVCRHHGKTQFVIDTTGAYRCRRCRVESVTRRRRKVKEVLVAEAGGCCIACGYSRYLGALHFHHVDPAGKRLSVAYAGVSLAIETLRAEAQKCVLLCSNCHAEVEGGATRLAGRLALERPPGANPG
jgi:transposase